MPQGTQILQQNPPLYDFSQLLGQYLMSLLQTNQLRAPGNPYRIDTPLTPTNQMWGRLAQQYAMSPAPHVMGQAAGTLGRFMNPDYSPLVERLRGGFSGFQTPQGKSFTGPNPGSGAPGRMMGGPVSGVSPSGGTYTVGEDGPETLQLDPGSSGFVQPNPGTAHLQARLRRLLGGF